MKQLIVVVFALLYSFVGNSQTSTSTKLYISSVNNLIKVGPLTNNTNPIWRYKFYEHSIAGRQAHLHMVTCC